MLAAGDDCAADSQLSAPAHAQSEGCHTTQQAGCEVRAGGGVRWLGGEGGGADVNQNDIIAGDNVKGELEELSTDLTLLTGFWEVGRKILH